MEAVLGNPIQGALYGLLAGISSFMFQLPLQLFFLECYAIEHEQCDPEQDIEADADNAIPAIGSGKTAASDEVEIGTTARFSMWQSLVSRAYLWKDVGLKVLANPVLWGIAMGFTISLSTVGLKYLKPEAKGGEQTVEGLAWIDETLEWFGGTVSPVSLFAMGLWMQSQGRRLIIISPFELFLFMVSKLFVLPLIMIGIAKVLGLDNEVGRAAVLIASLPISLGSFSLGSQYGIGEASLSANVAVGTILMTPTVIIWNVMMDAMDLFPINDPPM